MSDIDFDELDKAVNTLMSDVPKVEPPKTDDIKTLTINSTLPDDGRPSLAKLDSTLHEVNEPAPTPVTTPSPATALQRTTAPSLAARRGGRFMDVVHPSSDMKSATKSLTPASRQGVTIEPTEKMLPEKSDDQSDVTKAADAVTPESYKDLTVSDIAEPKANVATSDEHNAPANDWPDPLEMSGYSAEPDTNTVEPAAEEPAAVELGATTEVEDTDASIIADETLEYEDPQPLTSPFITDAKVEKRPLGGAPVEAPIEEPGHAPVLGVLAAEDEVTDDTDSNDQLPASPVDIEAQLPPELQSDLMAIETDSDVSAPEAAPAETIAPKAEPKPVVEAQTAPAPVSIPVAEPKASAEPVAAPAGPTSIPQQYHEEPSTSDEPNGSIYDTDSYHQPLAHPAKTKSGWLWIIWILLLLIVGGGGAVALYFIGII